MRFGGETVLTERINKSYRTKLFSLLDVNTVWVVAGADVQYRESH